MSTEEKYLQAIHEDMQSEVYEDAVNMRECPADYFINWYRWRVQNFPVEHITGNGEELRLQDFDIESVVSIMADWIKQPFSLEHKPTTGLKK